jgi:hypothetical protein
MGMDRQDCLRSATRSIIGFGFWSTLMVDGTAYGPIGGMGLRF